MGRRSRKRAGGLAGGAGRSRSQAGEGARRGGTSSRAERDAARAGVGRRGGARPPAPWGSFPLGEIVVLLGIVFIVWGLVTWGKTGRTMFGVGFALAALAGLELSIREHFAGFRSHTTLLSAAAAFAAAAATVLVGGTGQGTRAFILAIGGLVFAGCFWLLRQAFKRRSGGLSFR